MGGLELQLNKRKYIEKVLFVILNQPGHTLSLEERETVGEIVYDGIPASMRALFWIKCSGLGAYKSNYCDNYYKRLCAADESGTLAQYPNRHFQQIDKDLDRTAPDDPFMTPEIRQSLRRICRAYVWRNPTVGYC